MCLQQAISDYSDSLHSLKKFFDNIKPKFKKAVNQLIKGDILIIDDDITLLKILQLRLDRGNYNEIIIANTLDIAENILTYKMVKVVIVDFYFGDGNNSKDLCLQLKKNNIPVCVISSDMNDEVNKFCNENNIMFFKKPFVLNELVGFIDQQINKEK